IARRYAGRLHYGDNVELFAQASADALPSLKALKAIFGRLELFAGVGGRALVSLELRLRGGDQALVLFDGRGVQIPHRVPEPLVVLEVLLLHRPLLLGRHHRDAVVQRAVNLAVLVNANTICEAGEPPRQLGPEGEALTQRKVSIDRPERGDMFAADLSVDTTSLHQARLKAAALMSEADKHRSGIKHRALRNARFPCHYPTISARGCGR